MVDSRGRQGCIDGWLPLVVGNEVPVSREREASQGPGSPQADKPPHSHPKAFRWIAAPELPTVGLESVCEVVFNQRAGRYLTK